MKRLLFVLFGTLAFSGALFAQKNQETVYLKNGSIIHGNIIEQVPNQSLKIQTRDGNVFVYKIDEVEKITKEPYKSLSCSTGNYNLKTGFKGMVEAGYTFGDKSGGRSELLLSLGDQVNQYLFVGGGFGYNYYVNGDGEGSDVNFIPVFANIRGYIPINSIFHPFIDLKPGYGISLENDPYKGGFFMAAEGGVEFKCLSIGAGYSTQSMKYETQGFDINCHTGGFSIKLGIIF